jgi:outer membrane protein assembly factor BamA
VARSWLSGIEFEGNLSIRNSELLRNTDLSRDEEITDSRLLENTERIKAYYVMRGFPHCEVSFRMEPEGQNRRRVVFQIREGPGGFISDVRLEGTAGMSRTRLLSIVASMPGESLDGLTIRKDMEKLRRYS